MAVDLSKMSKAELVKLRKDVDKAIAQFDDRLRQEAMAELERKAKEMGFTLAELTGTQRKAKTKNPPKYRNPADATQTWTGRGRQPEWIKAAKAAGKNIEKFAI
ncbi:MAG: H-NS histone family protein [Pseudomonadota bacterium]